MEQKEINELCPWSGKPVSDDALTEYKGETVGFCNPGCRDKFYKAIALFEQCLPKQSKPKFLDPLN
jgi:YHS domain-containing protein